MTFRLPHSGDAVCIAIYSFSLEEAERLFAALEPTDLDYDTSSRLGLQMVETEVQIACALARKIGPEATFTPIQVFRHLDAVREATGADPSAIRSTAEYIGALLADAVMESHNIALNSAVTPQETVIREQTREAIMRHVADEILAGN